MPETVTVFTKPGCHLCETAVEVVSAVCAELDVPWIERSILDDPALVDAYGEQIPVVLIGARQHAFWTVDPDRLRRALVERSGEA